MNCIYLKKCTLCKIDKELIFFSKDSRSKDLKQPRCKDCNKIATNERKNSPDSMDKKKTYYLNNKERLNKKSKENYLNNKQYYNQISKKYYLENKEHLVKLNKKWKENNQDKYKELNKKHYKKNKEKINKRCKDWIKNNYEKYRQKQREREQRLPKNHREVIKRKIRARIRIAIKNCINKEKYIKDIGCSVEHFKAYMESKFKPGMTWENWSYYGWHLDHIKPLASFNLNDPEQFKEAIHYTNLQPLWWQENLKKGSKIE